MNDETIMVIVVVGMLGAFAFIAARLNVRKSSRLHSLGEMYRPGPRAKAPPTVPN